MSKRRSVLEVLIVCHIDLVWRYIDPFAAKDYLPRSVGGNIKRMHTQRVHASTQTRAIELSEDRLYPVVLPESHIHPVHMLRPNAVLLQANSRPSEI